MKKALKIGAIGLLGYVTLVSWPKVLREVQKGTVPEKGRTEAEEAHASGYHARGR